METLSVPSNAGTKRVRVAKSLSQWQGDGILNLPDKLFGLHLIEQSKKSVLPIGDIIPGDLCNEKPAIHTHL